MTTTQRTKHVLVTGGAGFIGSHVVALLRAGGHRVRVVDDLSSGRAEWLARDVELVRADVSRPGMWLGPLEGIDAVVHLAAIASVGRSVESPSTTHLVNLAATIRLAESLVEQGVPRLVYASSAAVYGSTERAALGEDDATAPVTPYAIDKLAGEMYGRFFAHTHGLDVRSLRLFNVFGPRQAPDSPYAGVISRFAERLLRGQPLTVFGDGHQTRDFVYVDDVAAVIARHAVDDTPAPSVMNVCSGQSSSLHDVIDALAPLIDRAPQVRLAPHRPGDIRHSSGISARLDAWYPDRPRTPLHEGLRHVVAWMRSSGSEPA